MNSIVRPNSSAWLQNRRLRCKINLPRTRIGRYLKNGDFRAPAFSDVADDIGDTLEVEGEEEQKLEDRMETGLSRVNKVRGDRYRSFFFEEDGIQAYISETDEGHLNISQTYLHEEESGVVAKPDLVGDIPDEVLSYKVHAQFSGFS